MDAPPDAAPPKILLTGRPGIGKTTVIRRIADGLGERPVAGFWTEEIREEGSRRGFRIVPFRGEERIMAHVDLPREPSVSKYGVDVGAVDAAVAEALEEAEDPALYLVDEIGRMECFSRPFRETIEEILGGDVPVVATVARRGEGLIARVKERPDVDVVEVTPENRDELPRRILDALPAPDDAG